jgi:hypothetical protein
VQVLFYIKNTMLKTALHYCCLLAKENNKPTLNEKGAYNFKFPVKGARTEKTQSLCLTPTTTPKKLKTLYCLGYSSFLLHLGDQGDKQKVNFILTFLS